MIINFRVKYHTEHGQSLWLLLSDGDGPWKSIPMQWLNAEEWRVEWKTSEGHARQIRHIYQLRDERNGAELTEWGGPRRAEIDEAEDGDCWFYDTWRSAGTVDYAFRTAAMQRLADGHRNDAASLRNTIRKDGIRLTMAAVPAGFTPAVCGSAEALGGWNPQRAVRLRPGNDITWECEVDLPRGGNLEYKYVLIPDETSDIVWETGENRVLDSVSTEAARIYISDEAFRRNETLHPRAAGVAIPVFSLRSGRGLGTGEFPDLKAFGDWAKGAGIRMIQVLPVNDTSKNGTWVDSYPYSAISVFALHPLYLCLEDLDYDMPSCFRDELGRLRSELNRMENVDYERVMEAKLAMSRRIFEAHQSSIANDESFREFCLGNQHWLDSHAIFRVCGEMHQSMDFRTWGDWAVFDDSLVARFLERHPEFEASYHFIRWLQFELDRQLGAAVSYLHGMGMVLKGDLPIGVDPCSVEAWTQPGLFHRDVQVGAPPDPFAKRGQNWGFPAYNWDRMALDGYAWWRARFSHLSRYFDAFRIDHILGFFRIWQIPDEQTEGIMGYFDPALPETESQLRERGVVLDAGRLTLPWLTAEWIARRFGQFSTRAKEEFLEVCGERFRLKESVSNQARIAGFFAERSSDGDRFLRDALLDCVSQVLALPVKVDGETRFHPRFGLMETASFEALDFETQTRLRNWHDEHFYRRHDAFWARSGLQKLPAMRQASAMLLCGEDLGLVPDCVPGVMRELGILSLEIQRMPKRAGIEFADPGKAPYLSVASPSTHDMPSLREWWREDPVRTSRFAWDQLGVSFPPADLSGELAARIIRQHLASPAMWAVFAMQDLLAIDESLRHADPATERINDPSVSPFYWRWRMPCTIEELGHHPDFSSRLKTMVEQCHRLS